MLPYWIYIEFLSVGFVFFSCFRSKILVHNESVDYYGSKAIYHTCLYWLGVSFLSSESDRVKRSMFNLSSVDCVR